VGGDNFSTVETVLLDSPRLPKTVEKHPFLEMFLQNRLTVAWSYRVVRRVLSSKGSLDHGDTHHQRHTSVHKELAEGGTTRSGTERAGGGRRWWGSGGWGAEQGEGGLML
jgi:hypothetical protein